MPQSLLAVILVTVVAGAFGEPATPRSLTKDQEKFNNYLDRNKEVREKAGSGSLSLEAGSASADAAPAVCNRCAAPNRMGPVLVVYVTYQGRNPTATLAQVKTMIYGPAPSFGDVMSFSSWGQTKLAEADVDFFTLASDVDPDSWSFQSTERYIEAQESFQSYKASRETARGEAFQRIMGITEGSGFAATAWTPGRFSRYRGDSITWMTMAHEVGHNWGISHANGFNPTSSRAVGTWGLVQYMDDALMGYQRSWRASDFSAVARYNLGWITAAHTAAFPGDTAAFIRALNEGPIDTSAKLVMTVPCSACVPGQAAVSSSMSNGGSLYISFRVSDSSRAYGVKNNNWLYEYRANPARSLTMENRVHVHFQATGTRGTELWNTIAADVVWKVPTANIWISVCKIDLPSLSTVGVSTSSGAEATSRCQAKLGDPPPNVPTTTAAPNVPTTTAAPTAPSVPTTTPSQPVPHSLCVNGEVVKLIWAGDGKAYDAKIQTVHDDGTVTLGWTVKERVHGAQLTKTDGTSCSPSSNTVVSGDCSIDAEGCARSPNFPNNYPDNSRCQVNLVGTIDITKSTFNIEPRYDTLTLNGKPYSGTGPLPANEAMEGTSAWASDVSTTRAGWKICTSTGPAPPAPPAPTANTVVSGTCTIDADGCALSPNFPQNYGDSEACVLALRGYIKQQGSSFNTESGYDFLTIGGVKYSGTPALPTTELSGTVTWSSDQSTNKAGFKICTQAQVSTCDETYVGNGAGYRGCQTLTRSGKTCQKWTSQTPHSQNLMRVGDHNFCRNPDGEPSIWCYTTDPAKRWEYCDPAAASRLDLTAEDVKEEVRMKSEKQWGLTNNGLVALIGLAVCSFVLMFLMRLPVVSRTYMGLHMDRQSAELDDLLETGADDEFAD